MSDTGLGRHVDHAVKGTPRTENFCRCLRLSQIELAEPELAEGLELVQPSPLPVGRIVGVEIIYAKDAMTLFEELLSDEKTQKARTTGNKNFQTFRFVRQLVKGLARKCSLPSLVS
ncbi:hypothetical protein MPNT_30181 [Candidatus Methylacidithermus pantelleriae]|uniref:Uncharacterized protein n=1 Tax=Candidatus Methylacidithermus pantelleriae TaxID=2744239 RepID=A0A8J2FWJ9_9BACT|nr:hypothetical protein MPNT_30181 [Candidatus Methylacidithermus pantelleriae]